MSISKKGLRVQADAKWDVIVIGAGMAGLSAAQRLQAAGRRVLVLDKSRGIGGRMATRRTDVAQWDHGAQYFTARSAAFRRQVAHWLRARVVSAWTTPVYAWDGQTLRESSPQQRFVGMPAMNSPLRQMAAQLQVLPNIEVDALQAHAQGWQVRAADQCWLATQVVLAIPAPQAAKLIPTAHPARPLAAQAQMQPCWAVMVSCAQAIQLPFAGAFINSGPLGWIAHDSSKAGRAGEHWVLHATPEWSQAQLEQSAEAVSQLLSAEFSRLLQCWELPTAEFTYVAAHRWRYARGSCEQPAPQQATSGLMLAGDWLEGGRVEGAYLSGLAAAEALLASAAQ